MFGIGAGTKHPELHHPDYDFPDEIIVTGTKMFHAIIKKVLN
jgi:metal-dependent amidase/aminoacylase/carboxypeptidase family protein